MQKRDYLKFYSLLLSLTFLCAACAPTPAAAIVTPTNTVAPSPLPATAATNLQIQVSPSSPSTSFDDKECIGTFYEFAYEIVEYEPGGQPKVFLPPANWELAYEFPDDGAVYNLINIIKKNDQTEIWTNRHFLGDGLPGDAVSEIIVYNEEFNQKNIISRYIEGTKIWVDRIFFHPDGTIWGRNMWFSYRDYSQETIPILSKYNPGTNSFEFDGNAFEFSLIRDETNLNDRVKIFMDEQGIFWYFVPYDGLYSYNPVTSEIGKHVDIPDFKPFRSMLAYDGNLYFTEEPFVDGVPELYVYKPKTDHFGVVTVIGDDWYAPGPWIYDSNERFWFGAVGWFSENEGWNLLHPEFADYVEKVTGNRGYWWATPRPILESSDGLIWFWKDREVDKGLAWYDPETGEGCWITNEIGGVFEDGDKNIWLSIENQLYRKQLEP